MDEDGNVAKKAKKEITSQFFQTKEGRRKLACSMVVPIRKRMLLAAARHAMSWGPKGQHLVAMNMAEAEFRYGKLTQEEIDYVYSGPKSLEESIQEKVRVSREKAEAKRKLN